MFESVLVANRGEIACRVIRTLDRLGIRSVAVCSEADRGALFTRLADQVIEIGPAPARESYLRADRVLEAARLSGAQAIHPGYGFLSENAAFAEACAAQGVRFIGPSPRAIAAMGLKDAAKAMMERAGVPVVPGYHGEQQDPARLAQEAVRIGFPVLIKAVAGGGGKGMRRVDRAEDFRAALEGAQREAAGAFGDERVLIEKYLTRPRHIELQVFADSHGHAVHLFERDCSLQRRHQKVLEEAPAPGMSSEMRAAMGAAAVKAALAIGYEGAGTVEFIADVSQGLHPDRFYFMEMNTRLQVEHPVTECITGLDLVEWQLRVAAGSPLPLSQDQIPLRGHAIEVRLYAEDPEQEYLPQTGQLLELALPAADSHVRVDTGVVAGDSVSIFYDPMIAKLIVWDRDRSAAARQLNHALSKVEILGLKTNTRLLSQLSAHPAFLAGDVHTGFLGEHQASLFAVDPALDERLWIACCVGLLETRRRARQEALRGTIASPWDALDGFRVNEGCVERLRLRSGERSVELAIRHERMGSVVSLDDGRSRKAFALRDVSLSGTRLDVMANGQRLRARYAERSGEAHVSLGGRSLVVEHPWAERAKDRSAEAGESVIKAPMPGKIIGVLVSAREHVKVGTPLLRLEAMKMEHTLKASLEGVVSELSVQLGEQVEAGSTLLVLKALEEVGP
ncbi:MAG: biotin carboxylase N-terminal domain-containing protein [Myxococcales bacterium]